MLSTIFYIGIIIGGSAVYMALGGSSEHNTNDETSNKCTINKTKSNEELTYDYFNSLSLEQQERYFNDNLDLKYYKEDSTCGFTNDKYYNAIHAKKISRRTGKVFNNINKVY